VASPGGNLDGRGWICGYAYTLAMVKIAIAGASGYAGGELLRLVLGHPDFELGPITAGAAAGKSVTSIHPQLPTLSGRVFAANDAATLAEADLAFLALPHGESGRLVAELPAHLPVVDLGADHRLVDATTWGLFFDSAHAGSWTYGLPELPGARLELAATNRVANPGCYATAITLGLAPLFVEGLIEVADLVAVAASGTSGAGRKVTESLLASQVMGSMSPYKVGGTHQHTPEVEQSLSRIAGAPVTLSFTPLLAPMSRGILATCTARLTGEFSTGQIRSALAAAYDSEPFVHLLSEGEWPRTEATYGSNSVQMAAVVDRHAGRVVVCVAIDNLGKGAAGQAVQNANILLGLPETAGLSSLGVAP
jgi:N-acetyl-gamma-glutamyl-phosphate reductase